MKHIIPTFIAITLIGCTKAPTETETLLVCEGQTASIIAGFSGKENHRFIITKLGDAVTKVKTEHDIFTLNKVEIDKENYKQLIVESDKLILRYGKNLNSTILFNNGAFTQDRGLSGQTEGQCVVSKKAF